MDTPDIFNSTVRDRAILNSTAGSWEVFPEGHEAESSVTPAATRRTYVCSTTCSIFRVTAGLPEKHTNISSVSHDSWFQDSSGLEAAQGALPQDPGEPFLPGPRKGFSLFEACHPQCSNHDLSGAVGAGLTERSAAA